LRQQTARRRETSVIDVVPAQRTGQPHATNRFVRSGCEQPRADARADQCWLRSAYDAGNYKKAIELGEKLESLEPDNPSHKYNLACLSCLIGKKAAAYDWLEKAVAAVERSGLTSIVACHIKSRLSNSGSVGVQWYQAITFHQQQAYVEISKACITAALIVPRAVWCETGPFDEDFPEAACEDWEWSTRATALFN
jgi:tetratricopeptide (TPR) repeat protein